jgi:hypothetical protein
MTWLIVGGIAEMVVGGGIAQRPSSVSACSACKCDAHAFRCFYIPLHPPLPFSRIHGLNLAQPATQWSPGDDPWGLVAECDMNPLSPTRLYYQMITYYFSQLTTMNTGTQCHITGSLPLRPLLRAKSCRPSPVCIMSSHN